MEEYDVEGVSLVVTGDIGQDAGAMTWTQLSKCRLPAGRSAAIA